MQFMNIARQYTINYIYTGNGASTWMFYQAMEETMGHRPSANSVSEELASQELDGRAEF